MARETKAELATRARESQEQSHLLERALSAAMTDGWEATERVTVKGDCRWTFYLCASTGSMGGIVVMRFDSLSNKQSPQFLAEYLERVHPDRWSPEIAPAWNRIRVRAREIQNEWGCARRSA